MAATRDMKGDVTLFFMLARPHIGIIAYLCRQREESGFVPSAFGKHRKLHYFWLLNYVNVERKGGVLQMFFL